MIHLESLVCLACKTYNNVNLFDNDARRPFVGTCGHSICLICANSNRNQNCPVCKKEGAFKYGAVNYSSSSIMGNFDYDIFQVIRKWWMSYETGTGVCSKCSAHKLLRVCETCKLKEAIKDRDLSKYSICESCSKSIRFYGGKFENLRNFMDLKIPLECHVCHTQVENPFFDNFQFQWDTEHLNLADFNFCSDCILDNHQDHVTSKILIYETTYFSVFPEKRKEATIPLLGMLLKKKLFEADENIKCKLRYMRMMRICEKMITTFYFVNSIGSRRRSNENFKKLVSNMEKQYNEHQQLKSPCPCLKVWKDSESIMNILEENTSFCRMVENVGVLEVRNECPLEFESNRVEKEQLMELIRRGVKVEEPQRLQIGDDFDSFGLTPQSWNIKK
ncbi:hypothetical protein L5515_013473 [Caenorhabditis briggsae]|uniref:RING-type domain-containing protein n=2 Tax=Caenorhabditis briggsae TaxID=6238 RepID=A0AAE9E8S7_CAEBR|nr:hypothetical protein L5515_013473 [Caenorhabditis briggsae]